MPSSPLSNSKPGRPGEAGYLLVGLLFMVALILVALAVAAPKMAVEIQRDKEQELIHRGNQYVRAIKLYYTKFGTYPTNISQLEKSNNIRFLRKKYKDPFTGKDDWRIIHLGEAKVPTMGLFGQPAATGTLATTTPGSGGGLSASPMGSGSSSSTGSTSGSSSPFSGASSSSPFSSSSSSSGSIFGSTGSTGSSSSTIGGGPIIGVASTVKRASLKEYKKQKHYNEWEFVYDPLAERLQGAGGLPASQSGAPGSTGGTTQTPTPTPSPSNNPLSQ